MLNNKNVNCNCSKYQPIELDRKSVNRRIRETKEILNSLVLLAENSELLIKLLKCPVCNQLWQTGREWNFKYKEYVFHIPEVEVSEWLQEPYAQPAALMIYSALMDNYFERNSFEAGLKECQIEGCERKAVKLSRFCEQHHIEQLQNVGLLPKRPGGKLFPPYK